MIGGHTQNQKQTVKRRRTPAQSSRSKVPKKVDVFSKEDLDLKRDLYPLANYIKDKNELIEQLFGVFSEQNMRKLVPTSLQCYTAVELKQKCLVELMKLEDDKILATIQAAYPLNELAARNTASSSVKNTANIQAIERTETPCSETVTNEETEQPDDAVENEAELADEADDSQRVFEPTLELCPDQNEVDSLIDENAGRALQLSPGSVAEESIDNPDDYDPVEEDPAVLRDLAAGVGDEWVSTLAKSQLEILELEMRARAIRSLMKSQGMYTLEEDSITEIKQPDNIHENDTEPEKAAEEVIEEEDIE